jgi:hypothetical protein
VKVLVLGRINNHVKHLYHPPMKDGSYQPYALDSKEGDKLTRFTVVSAVVTDRPICSMAVLVPSSASYDS